MYLRLFPTFAFAFAFACTLVRWVTLSLFLRIGIICAQFVYVDINATGLNNGSSWENAYTFIQDGIDDAANGLDVWVAKGTYYENLSMLENVALYGGFSGTETSIDERDIENNPTIIDANYSGSVIEFPWMKNNMIVDGFTITHGSAYGLDIDDVGSTIIRNCKIEYNSGRGIWIRGFGTSNKITRCLIRNNSSGIDANNSETIIYNNTIVNNSTVGIKSIGFYVPTPKIYNCIFWGNGDDLSYTANATYSCIEDGDPGTGNISADPMFVDPVNEDYHLQGSSPCIDRGSPNSPRDPDGTRSDIGAFYFDQTTGDPNIVVTPDTLKFSVGGPSLSNFSNSRSALSSSAIRKLSSKGIALNSLEQDAMFLTNSINVTYNNGDTLSNNFEPPFIIFNDEYQTEYEATRYVPSESCTLKTLLYAFWNNDNSERSKDCEFYVWSDNGGQPGSQLLLVEGTLTLAADVAEWVGVDISDSNLVVNGAFWMGHREKTSGAPSSLSDTLATPGGNYYSTDGTSWASDPFDYLQQVIVSYSGDGPSENEAVSIMQVSNTGDAPLVVSDITSSASWVKEITPKNFTVAPGTQQNVEVRVSSAGLSNGHYTGTLEVSSNDLDTPTYIEPLLFDVNVAVGTPDIVVTPDTLKFLVGGPPNLSSYSNSRSLLSTSAIRKLSSKGIALNSLAQDVVFLTNSTNVTVNNGDTLSNNFEPPFFPLSDEFQTEYEATRYVVTGSCTFKTLLYAFFNYDNSERSKDCEFCVWADNGGQPGTQLLSAEGTLTLASGEARWIGLDISESSLVVDGPFWIGHREKTSGAPSSLIDTVATPGGNYHSKDGTSWTTGPFDYLQQVIVSYSGDDPSEDEAVSVMQVSNTGDVPLEVTNITSSASWVIEMSPKNFIVAPGSEQNVEVRVRANGLANGQYTGTIEISSNDPDTPTYIVHLVFLLETAVEILTSDKVPSTFDLFQNYPNPFNPETSIKYCLPRTSHVKIEIFNQLGQKIQTLIDETKSPGIYKTIWNGHDRNGNMAVSGIYYYQMRAGDFAVVKKMTFVK